MNNMTRTERLIYEAKKHSILMLACTISSAACVFALLNGIQNQADGSSIIGFGLFTILLAAAAIINARESYRLRDLHDKEIRYQNEIKENEL